MSEELTFYIKCLFTYYQSNRRSACRHNCWEFANLADGEAKYATSQCFSNQSWEACTASDTEICGTCSQRHMYRTWCIRTLPSTCIHRPLQDWVDPRLCLVFCWVSSAVPPQLAARLDWPSDGILSRLTPATHNNDVTRMSWRLKSLGCLSMQTTKKTSKPRIIGLLWGCDRMDSPHKGQVIRKVCPCYDVILFYHPWFTIHTIKSRGPFY